MTPFTHHPHREHHHDHARIPPRLRSHRDVPEFFTDLEGGLFEIIVSKAISEVAAAVVDHNKVGVISGALRKYIDRNKLKDHIVKSTVNYEGTNTGRVWLVFVGKGGAS